MNPNPIQESRAYIPHPPSPASGWACRVFGWQAVTVHRPGSAYTPPRFDPPGRYPITTAEERLARRVHAYGLAEVFDAAAAAIVRRDSRGWPGDSRANVPPDVSAYRAARFLEEQGAGTQRAHTSAVRWVRGWAAEVIPHPDDARRVNYLEV